MKYLIAGLGNPGYKYEKTRHNIGFMTLDALAKASNVSFEAAKLGEITKLKHKGRTLILLKPNTFMNLSGKAVQYWLTKEKIPLENLLVVTDDLALPYGSVRMRTKGSDGGHNGLKDIMAKMANQKDFMRLRVGIGHPGHREMVTVWVLGKAPKVDQEKMDAAVDEAVRCMEILAKDGVLKAQNRLHSFKLY